MKLNYTKIININLGGVPHVLTNIVSNVILIFLSLIVMGYAAVSVHSGIILNALI